MTDLANQAKPSIEKLLQSDEDQLYEELGMRIKAYQSDLSVGASFAPAVSYQAELMGPLDDLRLFGKEFFRRMNRQAYELVCGNALQDKEERQKLAEAFKVGPGGAAAFLAALLVAHLGMAAGLAAVVAALLVRLFFRPAQEAMCQVWSQNVDRHAKPRTKSNKQRSKSKKK